MGFAKIFIILRFFVGAKGGGFACGANVIIAVFALIGLI
jgi:hypothetical protein